jgi:uncharacterized protein (TIGR02996 family)
MRWAVKHGDVLDEPADVLVCSANVWLNLSGGVGGEVLLRHGPQMQLELHHYLADRGLRSVGQGEVVPCGPCGTPFKAVLHAVAVDCFCGLRPEAGPAPGGGVPARRRGRGLPAGPVRRRGACGRPAALTSRNLPMMDDAFLSAIIESPGDDGPRLVYADWLEERGDPRAAAVRKHPEVFRFLSNLRAAPNAEAPLRQLEAWAFGGRADLVRGLALILGCRCAAPRPGLRLPGVPGPALERVCQALSPVPDARKAASVTRRLGRPPKPDKVPELASRLVSEHGPDVLLALLERYQQDGRFLELLACLAQEMVLRGAILDGVPAAERLAEVLRERGHPLARLPLALSAVEGDLRPWLPRYGGRGQAWSTPFGLSRQDREALPPGPPPAAVAFMEATDAATPGRIAAAVRDWQEGSNGQSEARVFRAGRPIAEQALSVGLLRSLGLACLEGAAEQDVWPVRAGPRDAFATLFSAASTGGAYSRGLKGAYGRLAAWESLAGLAGAPDDDVEAVADLAGRCLWVCFAAASGWYEQVAWDVGLLAVRPDGMSLAVLAATDTD